jgi:hypothetical protein
MLWNLKNKKIKLKGKKMQKNKTLKSRILPFPPSNFSNLRGEKRGYEGIRYPPNPPSIQTYGYISLAFIISSSSSSFGWLKVALIYLMIEYKLIETLM